MSTSFEDLGFIEDELPKREIPFQDDFEEMGFQEEKPISPQLERAARGFKFFGFEPSPEQIEPIRRKAGIALKELAGGVLGTPGDLLQFVSSLTGQEQRGGIIPTSEKISRGFEKLTGEEFNAQNVGEEIIGRGAGAIGSIFSLGGPLKGATALKGLTRTALAAIIPSAVSTVGEKAGLPKSVVLASTLGSALLTNRLTGKSLKQINKGLFKDAERLSKDQVVSATKLTKNLDSLEKTLAKGIGTGPKNALKGVVKDLKGKIKEGNIAVDELVAAKRDINERLGEFLNVKGSKNLFKAAGKIVDNGIKTFEETNPKFKEAFRDANSMFKGMNEAKAVEQWIKKHPLIAAESGILLKLFKPALSVKAVPVAIGIKSAELLTSLARNKGLRKAYLQVIKDMSKNEVRGTLNSLKKFNRIVERDEPQLLED